jgi:hypothetical protein
MIYDDYHDVDEDVVGADEDDSVSIEDVGAGDW